MSRFQWKGRNRRLVMTLVFGIGPLAVYFAFINPALRRISDYRGKVELQSDNETIADLGPSPASREEIEQLREIRNAQLSRIRRITDREALLRFSGALADALASHARSFGLRVKGVNLQNPSIKGMYLPVTEGAMDILIGLPAPRWEELMNPLDLPLLRMQSMDIQLTAVSEYSEAFSFIESLPDFPILVQLIALQTTDDSEGKGYQLTLRGYYCDHGNLKQTAQSNSPGTDDMEHREIIHANAN